ncbi:threonine synthase [Synergistales bacterium]|nr:threonine synthase [Synergistales bacterium]
MDNGKVSILNVRLVCPRCGAEFDEDAPENGLLWRCVCGSPLSFARSPRAIEKRVTMGEGNTPLLEMDIDGCSAWFKLDYLCPTGSYKDRGMAALVSRLKERGVKRVVEDSSGNAGASMAAYCAIAGIACDVYVPSYTSVGKCVQIESYGANLVRVEGSREDTTRAAEKSGEESYYASHNWNPWFLNGIGTWFDEAFETLPTVQNIVVPVGQGSIALGAYLAMTKLKREGRLSKYARIFAVQSENCAPLALAFSKGLDTPVKIEKKDTAAEGIASSEPVRGSEVLAAVRQSRGCFVTVSEDEIWNAFDDMAKHGIYIEPTSAAAVAGWRRLLWSHDLDRDTVVYLSGIGLKATDKISHYKTGGTI